MANLTELLATKVALIEKGQIVDATEKFLAANAKTVDFDGTITNNKAEMITKMKNFAGSIAKVNSLKALHTAVGGNVTFIELDVNFDMKDGSKVVWHEIIRSVWQNGEITHEQYFKG